MTATTLTQQLDWRCQQQPQATALCFLDDHGLASEVWPYQELRQRALSCSGRLAEYAGRPVALALETMPDFVVAFLACLYARAIPTPLAGADRRGLRRLNSLVQQCRPAAVISHDRRLHWEGLPVLSMEQLREDAGGAGLTEARPHDLALIQYSSGSTAQPQGVKVSHRQLLHNAAMMAECFQQSQGATLVGWLPLTHDMGLIGVFLQALYLGGRAILLKPSTFLLNPLAWLRAISDYRAQISGGPDFGYQLCCQKITAEQRRSLDLSEWKVAFNGSEMVRPATLDGFSQMFADCGFSAQSFYPVYGLAEATLLVASRAHSRPVGRVRLDRQRLAEGEIVLSPTGVEYVSCGQTWGGHVLSLRDTHQQVPGPVQLGQVFVQGPCVSPGYWRGAALGPALATGDLGFVWDGEIYLLGRCADKMVFRGQNHHPEDLEHSLEKECAEIACGGVCVFDVPGIDQDELVVVVEVRRSLPAQLVDKIRSVVAREHGLSLAHLVGVKPGALPKGTSGKLQRNQCRRLFLSGQWDTLVAYPLAGCSANESEIAHRLVDLIAEALAGPGKEVDLDTPFQTLGLDSVQRLTLVGDLAHQLDRTLAGDLTWHHPTPRALCLALATPRRSSALRTWREGKGVPLIVIHGLGGDVFWAESLIRECPQLPALALRRVDASGQPLNYSSVEELGRHHAALIDRERDGPLRLLGYSYGCKYVFETARQLQLLGRELEFVGLIDGYPTTKFDLPWKRLVARARPWRQRQLWTAGGRERTATAPGLDGWAAVWVQEVESADLDGLSLHPNSRPHLQPGRVYRPQPCPLRIHLFRTRGHEGVALGQPGGGWESYAQGGVRVIEVEGEHVSIMKFPHVAALASALLMELGSLPPRT